jgi:hypothetical protein
MTSSSGVSGKVMNEWFEAAGSAPSKGTSKPDVKTLERLLDEHKGKLDINATIEGGTRSALALPTTAMQTSLPFCCGAAPMSTSTAGGIPPCDRCGRRPSAAMPKWSAR